MLFSLLKWIANFLGQFTLEDRIGILSALFCAVAMILAVMWRNWKVAKEETKEVKKRMLARLAAARTDSETDARKAPASRWQRWEERWYKPILRTRPGRWLAAIVRQGSPAADAGRFTVMPNRPERMVTYLLANLLIFLALFSLTQGAPVNGLLLGVIIDAALVGLWGYRAHRAQQAFTEQLPEVFNSLAMSVRTENLMRAFLEVAQRLPDPAATEFRTVYNDIRKSQTPEKALDDLLERRPSPDLHMGVTAIRIQQELGGSLSPVLSTIAEAIRTRRRTEAEIRTTTLHARSTVAIVAVIAPALVVIMSLIFPGYFTPLLRSSAGPALIFLAAIGEFVGIAWTWWLARTKY